MGNRIIRRSADHKSVLPYTCDDDHHYMYYGKVGSYKRIESVKDRTEVINGSKKDVVFVLHSYEDEDKLSFEKDDQIVIYDHKEPNRWLAFQTSEPDIQPIIPINFLVNAIEPEEWFFSVISRSGAEKLLLIDDYPRGTFLIRNSETHSGPFSLSILDFDSLGFDHVRHYKIKEKRDGHYYISSRRPFARLQDLVRHYSESSDPLCCQLSKPCPKDRESLDLYCPQEIDRRDSTMEDSALGSSLSLSSLKNLLLSINLESNTPLNCCDTQYSNISIESKRNRKSVPTNQTYSEPINPLYLRSISNN